MSTFYIDIYKLISPSPSLPRPQLCLGRRQLSACLKFTNATAALSTFSALFFSVPIPIVGVFVVLLLAKNCVNFCLWLPLLSYFHLPLPRVAQNVANRCAKQTKRNETIAKLGQYFLLYTLYTRTDYPVKGQTQRHESDFLLLYFPMGGFSYSS